MVLPGQGFPVCYALQSTLSIHNISSIEQALYLDATFVSVDPPPQKKERKEEDSFEIFALSKKLHIENA